MLVSGVFNSWLTVATMLLFTSSSRRKRVTSSSSTAAPSVADDASRIGRTRGRYECGCSACCEHDDLVETFGHILALLVQGFGQGLAARPPAAPRRRAPSSPCGGGRPKRRRAAGLAISTLPLRIDHQHRLGKRVDRRLARLLGADQLGLVRLAELAKLTGHGIEGRGQLPQFIVGGDRHNLVEVAGPDGHGRFRRRADRVDDHANRVPHEKNGQHDAARQTQAIPDQRGAGQALRFSSTSFMFFSFSRRMSPETVLISWNVAYKPFSFSVRSLFSPVPRLLS